MLLVATVVWIAPPARGEANGYGGAEFALLDATKARAAASEFTSDKYPNDDQATIEQKSVRVYRTDGTGESQTESFVKVLTEKGRREKRTLTFGFMLPYSTTEVSTLELVRPDGQLISVDVAANSKESIDDSQMSSNIYDPNVRVLSVNIPKLEVGDVVHVVVRETTQRSYIPGEFADENVFEGEGYIRHMVYEVHAPADHPLRRIAMRDRVAGTVRDSVETNVRYMGLTPEKDRPGFEPHNVCITFNKKYGVCRDKAALLVSLLHSGDLTHIRSSSAWKPSVTPRSPTRFSTTRSLPLY